MQPEGQSGWTTFGHQAALQPNAERVVDAALSRWRDIDARLSPIIGERGVLALLARSIHLRQIDHPGLHAVQAQAQAQSADAFGALRTALLAQTPTAATATDTALRQTFIDLLGRLIGAALTDRLIGSIRP